MCEYNEIVNKAPLALCGQRFQQDLHPESAQLMSSDATTERALNRDIAVTVNIIVLTAPTRSTAVRPIASLYSIYTNTNVSYTKPNRS